MRVAGRSTSPIRCSGAGPIDLVFVMGWVSHLEYFWNEPSFARFLRRLAGFSRLILFDKRGTGLSDRHHRPAQPGRTDGGCQGGVERGRLPARGAARRVRGRADVQPRSPPPIRSGPKRSIMIGTYARRPRAADYPWAPTHEEREAFCREILERWGGPVGIETRAPSVAADPAFREWWAAYLRMGASPAAAVALTRMNAQIDVRHVLPTIRVPTLVLHRTGDRCLLVEEGRYVASLVPSARFVELPGDDHLPFVGDHGRAPRRDRTIPDGRASARRIEQGARHDPVRHPQRTERRGPTAAEIDRLQALVAAQTQRFRGRGLPRADDRAFSAFDGPARAIRCGRSIVDEGLRPGRGARHRTAHRRMGQAPGRRPGAGGGGGRANRGAGPARRRARVPDRRRSGRGSGFQFSERGKRGLAAGEEAQPLFAVR